MSDLFEFSDDDTQPLKPDDQVWKIFIIDDDRDIHDITKLALKDLMFKNKTISFESAYSAEEAIKKLNENAQYAVVLLDIGMETIDAGLEVARFIRNERNDHITRIIIRTGQPGDTPEHEIIDNYDINDFKSKTELTRDRLFSTIRTAIAQYAQISELAELNNELEERIERALLAQREQQKALILQDRTVQMGELLNMLAHQWRQPLSRIAAVTSQLMLALELDEIDSQLFSQQIRSVETYTHELSEMIDKFRSVYEPSRLDKDIPLYEILKQSVSIIKASFNNEAINIQINSNPYDRRRFTSPALFQVILSLLKNSEEAFERTDVADPSIRISTSHAGDTTQIYIEDNAGGIDEAIIDRIFEPYFSTKSTKHGHGLGLYMSKMILEQNCDGKLAVENSPSGVCFTITLANK